MSSNYACGDAPWFECRISATYNDLVACQLMAPSIKFHHLHCGRISSWVSYDANFKSTGYLVGVVVAPQLGLYQEGRVTTSKGRELELTPIAQVLEELQTSDYKNETDMIMALKSHQQMLLEFAPVSWKLPEEEWMDTHPLEEFAEAGKSIKTRLLRAGKAPRGKLLSSQELKSRDKT
ncbi:hypothetical protein SELMODRAFT_410762 [Selaginella moellendorffii]|uniref:Uncharacterized protein n=1 Tax=Selaginella moellendorffii TaxID=88036 RepID=D8RFS7_SELML|nr:hypothetical protein SELMODRAFT_410762 [Selaginella moellendorffii]